MHIVAVLMVVSLACLSIYYRLLSFCMAYFFKSFFYFVPFSFFLFVLNFLYTQCPNLKQCRYSLTKSRGLIWLQSYNLQDLHGLQLQVQNGNKKRSRGQAHYGDGVQSTFKFIIDRIMGDWTVPTHLFPYNQTMLIHDSHKRLKELHSSPFCVNSRVSGTQIWFLISNWKCGIKAVYCYISLYFPAKKAIEVKPI